MLNENLKSLRKARGLSQEGLAMRLNVVRQTISKWENGLSVPDADLLIRTADILDVSVSELLGAKPDNLDNDKNMGSLAEQLAGINEQLAIKNRRARRVWKTVAIVIGSIAILYILLILLAIPRFGNEVHTGPTITEELIELEPVNQND